MRLDERVCFYPCSLLPILAAHMLYYTRREIFMTVFCAHEQYVSRTQSDLVRRRTGDVEMTGDDI